MADHVSKESILGVIGLGNAGHAIASALAKLMPVHGYDLEEDKRLSASQIGIITHDQFDTFTEAIDVAILSLPHPEISFSVTEQLLGLVLARLRKRLALIFLMSRPALLIQ